ncbi:MAG: NUDIX domain-containing protein [Nanoarchaeota archaeon]|nr:NUDIX domain-containing protein [Nanoarchaeota archaeon]
MVRKAVVGVVNYNGKVLVGKKKQYSNHFLSEKWHVPGETLEEGESFEEALVRGMLEGVGISVRVGKCLGEHETTTHKLVKWYECFSDTDDVHAGSDLQEVRWVSKEEVLDICSERAIGLWPSEIVGYFKN